MVVISTDRDSLFVYEATSATGFGHFPPAVDSRIELAFLLFASPHRFLQKFPEQSSVFLTHLRLSRQVNLSVVTISVEQLFIRLRELLGQLPSFI